MTRETFNQGFATLFNAYVYAQERTTVESEKVYWMMLKDIPDEIFNKAVQHCLAYCEFFPAISKIGEASYPTIEEVAPYNAFVYHEPRKIGWQEQIRRLVERRAIESGGVAPDRAGALEPPEMRNTKK